MKKLIKATILLVVSLVITTQTNSQPIPARITNTPAIDVSYKQVQSDLTKHLGVNVRWGGQIIDSQQTDTSTLVILQAFPLDTEGKPSVGGDIESSIFVVDYDKNSSPKNLAVGNYITVYGSVEGDLELINGPLQMLVPVVTSQEIQRWAERYVLSSSQNQNDVVSNGLTYYNFQAYSGFSQGYGGINQFGNRNSFFGNSFGNSRFGFNNNRFGFNNSRFGFSNSRFGFGGNQLGFGNSRFGFGFGIGSRGSSSLLRFGR